MRASCNAFCRRSPAWPCYDSFLFAELAPVAGGIRHGVGLVENDDTVKIESAEPIDDLLHAAGLVGARLGAQRRVSRKEDSFRRARSARPRRKSQTGGAVGAATADRGPVALGVLDRLSDLETPESPCGPRFAWGRP